MLTPGQIKDLRFKLGMTQLEFAFWLGVSQNTVSKWENGHKMQHKLAERAVRRLAAEHDITITDLVDRKTEESDVRSVIAQRVHDRWKRRQESA